MMGAVYKRCADISPAFDSEPLRVVSAYIVVVPGEDDVTALISPLPQQIGVAFGQGDSDNGVASFFVNPGAEGGEQLSFDLVEFRSGIGVDSNVEPAPCEIGFGPVPIDLV